MIQSLHIRNLQSHKDSHLDFCEGVNVIVGPSDSGKSAILRALRWIVKNRPQGDVLRSHWGGDTEVNISLHESGLEIDPEVTRMKGKTDEYNMNGSSFKALRGDVPQEIQDVLNMTDINLQRQLDQPFLLSNTPGKVALHFNRIAKLDKIDTANQRINSWIKQLSNEIAYKEDQRDKLSEQIKTFDYLEKMEIEVEALEALEDRYTKLCLNKSNLFKLIQFIEKLSTELSDIEQVTEMEEEVVEILELYNSKKEKQEKLDTISTLIQSIEETETDIAACEVDVEIEWDVNVLLAFYEKLSPIVSDQKQLTSVIEQVGVADKRINYYQNYYDTLHQQYEDEFPETCPLCGKPK